MGKASDNIFPKVRMSTTVSSAAPSGGEWRLESRANGIYAVSSNTGSAGTGPFGVAGAGLADQGTATYLDFTTAAAPANPAAGKIRVYSKTGDTFSQRTSGGTETVFGAGSGGGGLVLITQQTASASATLDFTTWYSATYDEYLIEYLNLIPASGANQAWLRMSTDGGATYDTGANYAWTDHRIGPAGAAAGGTTGDSKIVFTGGGNSETLPVTATKGLSGSLRLFSPASTAVHKSLVGQSVFDSTSALLVISPVAGQYRSTTAVNAFRVLMASGNIASGIVRVYGLAK